MHEFGNTVPAGALKSTVEYDVFNALVVVNPTVHRAPVAPATAGTTDADTPVTAVGPADRLTAALTASVSVDVEIDTDCEPAVPGLATSSMTSCRA